MIKLTVEQTEIVNGKEKKRSRTFQNISDDATNENLLKAGKAVATLMKGDNSDVIKVEATSLVEA